MVCPNCGSLIEEGGAFCRSCGFNLNNAAPYQQQQNFQQPAPAYDPFDHTSEFSAADVAKNKVFAALVYVLGPIGLIIAILINQTEKSDYLSFHIREGAKLTGVSMFCWCIPVLGWIVALVLLVVSLISFCKTLSGKSTEPLIISSFASLK